VIDRADTLGWPAVPAPRPGGSQLAAGLRVLLYRRRDRLSDEARKRLQAIFNASELGAGFQIALSDLEIRGAGNILGGEQSGHMAAVGFDLYTRLLAEAVEERKASWEGRAAALEPAGATVDLPVDAHLPDAYVPDEAAKLELYRRLARARTPGDLASFRQEVATGSDPRRRRFSGSWRWPSCASLPRRPGSRPSPARRASSWCASARVFPGRGDAPDRGRASPGVRPAT